jgi:hypothetical protein
MSAGKECRPLLMEMMLMPSWKSRFNLGGAFMAAAMLTACSDPSSNAPVTTTTPEGQSAAPASAAAARRDTALVRMVHAIPSGSTVDVTADDMRMFEGVSFRDITSYKEVAGQRYAFALRGAGTPANGEPLARNSEGLDDGEYYTVFALPGDDGQPTLRVVEDDHEVPEAGKARVRVVHAAANAGELDVVVAGQQDALISGVDFRAVTGYDEIDPQVGELTLRTHGGTTAVANLGNVSLEAGKTYTIVVVGGTGSKAAVETLVFQDVLGTAGM